MISISSARPAISSRSWIRDVCSAPERSSKFNNCPECRRSIRPVFDAPPILKVEGLNAGYGRSQVLFDLAFTAAPVGALAILGRNGAGKTTLLKTLAGEIRPASGRIVLDGADALGMSTEVRVRRGLGYVPQEYAVFDTLTVRENLRLGAIRQPDN